MSLTGFKMFFKISIIFSFVIITSQARSQSTMYWFDPTESSELDLKSYSSSDCMIQKDEIDEDSGIRILEFKQRPIFMHTHPEFKKWMKDKFLMECSASLYKAGETAFLLLEFKINSENAKHAYGNLNKGAQIKITFADKEHIYLENIERDRGTAKRSKKYTVYTGVFPIDKGKLKELQRREMSKIGIVWEEGYQEYEILSLIHI